jgi:hypothetical protein
MSEQLLSGGGPTSDSDLVCPWCSAALNSAAEERCPSCGAALKEPDTAAVPGVTQIDVEAIIKGRTPTQKPRGLIGWLAGEYEADAAKAPPPGTLEPPGEAVRREMLRLELAALEAEVLARQAEAVAEVATETGEPVDLEDLGLAAESGDVGGEDRDVAEAADVSVPEGPLEAAPDASDEPANGDDGPDAETREG